jgi:hypothetical protein
MNEIDLYKLRDLKYRDEYVAHILNFKIHPTNDFIFLDYLYELYNNVKCQDYDIKAYIFYGISVLYLHKLLHSSKYLNNSFMETQIKKYDDIVLNERSNPLNPFLNLFVGISYFHFVDVNKAMKFCKNGIDEILNSKDIPNSQNFIRGLIFACNLFKKTVNFKDIITNNDNISLDITTESDIKIHTNKLHKNELFVVNFTCDPVYFLTLALNVSKYLLQLEGFEKFGIFFHIIYKEKQLQNTGLINIINTKINEIVSYVTNNKGSIIITYESANVAEDKALYTTNRFINMKKFLEITKKDIIQMDIDTSDMKGFNIIEFYNQISVTDISLFKNNGFPWEKICACCSYFKNNKFSYEFSEYYKRIFKRIYDPSRTSNWFIDQYCLYLTYLFVTNYFSADANIGTLWKHIKKTPGLFHGTFKEPLLKETKEKYKDYL